MDSNSRTFHVVLDADAVIQLDELVTVSTALPDGREVTHYGIVTELLSRFEGADLPSDTGRVIDRTLPAELVRRAEVRVLRVVPELFLAPHAGATVTRAAGDHRAVALFEDEMSLGKLPLGIDLGGEPVYADMRFVDGRAGGHVSISRHLRRRHQDLLRVVPALPTAGDRARHGVAGRPRPAGVGAGARVQHQGRGSAAHGPSQRRVRPTSPRPPSIGSRWTCPTRGRSARSRLYAPRGTASGNNLTPDVQTRSTGDVHAYGWTPEQFVREQLLQFCFTSRGRTGDPRSASPNSRCASSSCAGCVVWKATPPARVVIAEAVPPKTGYNPDRLAERDPEEAVAGDGHVVRDFGDLIDLLERIAAEEDESCLNEWFGRTQAGTRQAFLRRLLRLRRHLGPLVGCGLQPLSLENARLHVVDISRLHDDAQRFVVGALLDRIWREKQGTGRLPLRFVVLDELNKYAPAQGYSPLKELLVDIAERGRSLGVLLIGAQQAASAVAQALPRNASLKVAGRLDASESEAYRFLTPALAGARDPLHAGHHGGVAADRPGADPDPVSLPAVRDQPGRGRAGHRLGGSRRRADIAQFDGAFRRGHRAMKRRPRAWPD